MRVRYRQSGYWIGVCCISLLALIVFERSNANSEVPSSVLTERSQTPKIEQQNKRLKEDQRGTEKSPLFITIVPETTENNDGKHSSEWLGSAEIWIAVFTGLLWLTTAFLAGYTAKLWTATKTLVEGANNAEAAYLLPHITRHAGFFDTSISGGPEFHYGFKNHGKTIAIIRRWRDRTVFEKSLPPRLVFEEPWSSRPPQYIPIPAEGMGGDVFTQVPEEMAALDVLSRLGNDGQWLYILGEVEYEDIFGVVRVQGYCLRIMSVERTGGCRSWIDGGSTYNYRTLV
jgi:hypothetical protein